MSPAVFGAMGMVWNVNTTTLMQQRALVGMLGCLSTPALLAAAFFVLSVAALIPALKADVSVVEPDDDETTARVPS